MSTSPRSTVPNGNIIIIKSSNNEKPKSDDAAAAATAAASPAATNKRKSNNDEIPQKESTKVARVDSGAGKCTKDATAGSAYVVGKLPQSFKQPNYNVPLLLDKTFLIQGYGTTIPSHDAIKAAYPEIVVAARNNGDIIVGSSAYIFNATLEGDSVIIKVPKDSTTAVQAHWNEIAMYTHFQRHSDHAKDPTKRRVAREIKQASMKQQRCSKDIIHDVRMVHVIVMEKYATTLANFLDNDATTVYDTLRALEDAATGIEQLHEVGIVHNDIRPSNFLGSYSNGDKRSVFYLSDMGQSTTVKGKVGNWNRQTHASWTALEKDAAAMREFEMRLYLPPWNCHGIMLLDEPNDIYSLAAMTLVALGGEAAMILAYYAMNDVHMALKATMAAADVRREMNVAVRQKVVENLQKTGTFDKMKIADKYKTELVDHIVSGLSMNHAARPTASSFKGLFGELVRQMDKSGQNCASGSSSY